LELEQLDPVLARVVNENRGKVISWVANEPGAWGYLAGQGVTATRHELGRPLTDQERRLVWRRLWWILEQVKAGTVEENQ
jgi:hypothetical protein